MATEEQPIEDRDDATIAHQEGMDEQEQPIIEERYKKGDFTLKGWENKITEEEARWRHLGISLDQMNYAGSEIFAMQAKLQALTNCAIEGNFSEENLNLWLKTIVCTNMETIRENIEPQIAQAKLMQGVPRPQVVLPWMKPGDPNNGS